MKFRDIIALLSLIGFFGICLWPSFHLSHEISEEEYKGLIEAAKSCPSLKPKIKRCLENDGKISRWELSLIGSSSWSSSKKDLYKVVEN